VEEHESVAARDLRAAVELPRAHRLAFEDRRACAARDLARPVGAAAVGDDHLVRAGGDRRCHRRADPSLFIPRRDHHRDGHGRMLPYECT
jgi:hypothetical protein